MSSTERRDGLAGELIRVIPFGKENALPRCALAAKMETDDRTVRKLIEKIRDEGVMICNDQDGKGYYIAVSTDEVERQYRRDLARAKKIMKRLRASRMLLQAAGRATE